MAAINLDYVFDPAFYRSAYGFDNSETDATLYRHWLKIGLMQGFAANEEDAVRTIMVNPHYASCFDWHRYKAALPRKEASELRHRIDVLRHLFARGFEEGQIEHIGGEHSDELYKSLGEYHLVRGHHNLAIAAYDRALAVNPSMVASLHRRGDAYASIGKVDIALADYVHAAAFPNAPLRSSLQAARTAAARGLFEINSKLGDARLKWEKSADYRTTVTQIIEDYFAAKSWSAMALYEPAIGTPPMPICSKLSIRCVNLSSNSKPCLPRYLPAPTVTS